MADNELQQTRAAESLTLTVLRLKNLRGLRGDSLIAMIKVEWNEKVLGESVKIECTPDEMAELNYTTSITVNFDDPRDLDDVAHKPILCEWQSDILQTVLVSIIEVLPKEKRQKEEKVSLIGQCTVDLFPMLTGKYCLDFYMPAEGSDKTKDKQTLTIHSVAGSPIENLASEIPKPELDLQLSVTEPLISSASAQETNLLDVTIESLYSPPEAFQLSNQQFAYVASLPLPINAERESTLVFGGGVIKPGIDKEAPCKEKKWLLPGASALPGNANFISHSFLATDPIDKEDGDYRSQEDREHRTVSEQDKNRVLWNTERRCFLEPAAGKSLSISGLEDAHRASE
ncbi:cilia- and flagella-associated protein 70-like [Watersipora subatra]|uniref:cilia- and flagella-associated protein 70-like n=1 Tax=Watersipora subatra TaxID=2589382 RepID=UPI00355B12C8